MASNKEDRLIIEAYSAIYESYYDDYNYESILGPNGEYIREYFEKYTDKYDPSYLPILVNNVFEGDHPAREAMATSSIDPITGVVKEILPNDKNMTNKQAKEMLFNWWCSTYENDFGYKLDDETEGDDGDWIDQRDVRSMVLKDLKNTLNGFAADYHIWKKQQDIKDTISKNNQTGWDL